jgi:twitching motility protein PilT
MTRIDAFLSQLAARGADSLVLESGNTIFLVKGSHMEPLVASAPGALQNQHVGLLLSEIAPPDVVKKIEAGEPCEFRVDSSVGPLAIEFVVPRGKFMARLRRVGSVGAATSPAAASPVAAASSMAASAPMANASPAAAEPQVLSAAPAGRPRIEPWFEHFIKSRASDLHLTSTQTAMLRIDGDMVPVREIPVCDAEEMGRILVEIMPDRNKAEWAADNDTDFAFEMNSLGARLRCNVFRDRRGPGACFRKIPTKILSAQDLNLPPATIELCKLKKGLVVVTGPTGSGKSTTLAAMVDWVNANRADHIITIEDPIEFVHEPKKCMIHQRQVGPHTNSFTRALRAALREDPDIILVGEMRDLETVAIAIEMAETGHLVFGTLHTTTAASTIDRIVDQFSADRQEQVRQMLSESLKGVIAQTLCKKKGGGRIAALEILICSTAVSNLIREHKTFQIPSLMQTQKAAGMRTLNDSLITLVKDGVVTPEEAYDKGVEKPGLQKALRDLGHTVGPQNLTVT